MLASHEVSIVVGWNTVGDGKDGYIQTVQIYACIYCILILTHTYNHSF